MCSDIILDSCSSNVPYDETPTLNYTPLHTGDYCIFVEGGCDVLFVYFNHLCFYFRTVSFVNDQTTRGRNARPCSLFKVAFNSTI